MTRFSEMSRKFSSCLSFLYPWKSGYRLLVFYSSRWDETKKFIGRKSIQNSSQFNTFLYFIENNNSLDQYEGVETEESLCFWLGTEVEQYYSLCSFLVYHIFLCCSLSALIDSRMTDDICLHLNTMLKHADVLGKDPLLQWYASSRKPKSKKKKLKSRLLKIFWKLNYGKYTCIQGFFYCLFLSND